MGGTPAIIVPKKTLKFGTEALQVLLYNIDKSPFSAGGGGMPGPSAAQTVYYDSDPVATETARAAAPNNFNVKFLDPVSAIEGDPDEGFTLTAQAAPQFPAGGWVLYLVRVIATATDLTRLPSVESRPASIGMVGGRRPFTQTGGTSYEYNFQAWEYLYSEYADEFPCVVNVNAPDTGIDAVLSASVQACFFPAELRES